MATFKVRRTLTANGGLTVNDNLTTASSVKFGSAGTTFTKLIAGTVSACIPAMNASTLGTASAAISDLTAGAFLIMQFASKGASGIGLVSCSAVATNSASMDVFALAGATTASTMTFTYIAVS